MNKVILTGNVGKDPIIKYLPSGNAVANFSLATTEKWKDKNSGEKQEKTEWHNIVVFGRMAETIGQYVGAGSKLGIEGKIQTTTDERDGVKRYFTKIVAQQVEFLNLKGGQGGGGDYEGGNRKGNRGGVTEDDLDDVFGAGPVPPGDDDVPF